MGLVWSSGSGLACGATGVVSRGMGGRVEPVWSMVLAGLAGWVINKAGDSSTRWMGGKARKLLSLADLSLAERALAVAVRNGVREATQYVYSGDADRAEHVADSLFQVRDEAALPLVDGGEVDELPVAVRDWIAEALFPPRDDDRPNAETIAQAAGHELLSPLVAAIVHHIRYEAIRGGKVLDAFWLEHCLTVPSVRKHFGPAKNVQVNAAEMEIVEIVRAQRDVADRLPHDVVEDDFSPRLSEVFVPRTLRRVAHKPASNSRSSEMDSGVEVRTLESLVDDVNGRHILIIGEPGTGKSSAAQHIVRSAAMRWLSPAPHPNLRPSPPLRIHAAKLALDEPFGRLLAKEAQRVALPVEPVDERWFTARVAGARWLIVVDGLDEVTDRDDRDRVLRQLQRVSAQAGAHRLVILTRNLPERELQPLAHERVHRYSLGRFSRDQLEHFARHWFNHYHPQSADTLCRSFIELTQQPHLADVVRVPLFASVAAALHAAKPDRQLPTNRLQLVGQFVDDVQRPPRHCRDQDHVITVPARLASHLKRDEVPLLLQHIGVRYLDGADSLMQIAEERLLDNIAGAEVLPRGWKTDLRHLLLRTGLFTVAGTDVAFIHRAFAEYLAAQAHSAALAGGVQKLSFWIDMAKDPRTQNLSVYVLSLYLQREPSKQVKLIRQLMRQQQDSIFTQPARPGLAAAARMALMGTIIDEDIRKAVIRRLVDEAVSAPRGDWADVVFDLIAEFGPHPEVIQQITQLANNTSIPVSRRAQAAECYGWVVNRPEGLAMVETLCVDATRGAALRVADALDALSGEHHPAATQLLTNLATSTVAPLTSRVDAARRLAIRGLTKEAARVCEAIMQEPFDNSNIYGWVAELWLALEGESATTRIVELVDSENVTHWVRADVCRELARQGSVASALEIAVKILESPESQGHDDMITEMVEALTQADSKCCESLIDTVLAQKYRNFDDTAWTVLQGFRSADGLAKVPIAIEKAAIGIITHPDARAFKIRFAAREWLQACGQDACTQLLEIAAQQQQHTSTIKSEIAAAVTEQDPGMAVQLARAVLADETADLEDIASAVSAWLTTDSSRAPDILNCLSDSHHKHISVRVQVAQCFIDYQATASAKPLFESVLTDPLASLEHKTKILKLWGKATNDEGVRWSLTLILDDDSLTAEEAEEVIDTLNETGYNHLTTPVWQRILIDPDANVPIRLNAADYLRESAPDAAIATLKSAITTAPPTYETERLKRLLKWITNLPTRKTSPTTIE